MDQREDNYLILFKCINPRQHEALRSVLDQYPDDTFDFLQILKKFNTLDNLYETQESVYKYDFQADLRCLKKVFKGTLITEDDIRTTLKILTGVPNPAMVAAKLLLHKIETTPRKRTATFHRDDLNMKQTKFELDESVDLDVNRKLDEAAGSVKLGIDFPALSTNISEALGAPAQTSTNESENSDTYSLEASSSVPDDSVILVEDADSELETMDEAAGSLALPVVPEVDQRLVWKVLEMFPNVSREYLDKICQGKTYNDSTFAEILDRMLESDYPTAPPRSPSPKVSVTYEEQLAVVKEMLPDADPTYLEEKVQQLGDDKEALHQFIEHDLMTKSYPTMKDYLRRTQLSAQQRQYTTEFNVQRFVELFPDPKAVFEAPDRKSPSGDDYIVCIFMRNMYPQLYVKDIQATQKQSKCIHDIVKTLDELLAKNIVKKKPLKPTNWKFMLDCQNIPLLQELAYFQHKQEILDYIEKKEIKDAKDRLQAKKLGQLKTCSCCFDEEVMPNDMVTCLQGCGFCKTCVKRSSEIAVGEGKVNFPCLSDNCNAEFSLQVLQTVLEPKVFSKMAQKKALAEVKAVLTDELESCPFCDFANIPAPEDKLFRCLNPECMKESCRLCKEPSHIPLRCDEVEQDEHVKARTYVENKMTDALIRECWKCKNRFYKDEGCNKMTCVCGAMTCYVCRKPVRDYSHFNGQGGDRFDLCPLYTDNFTVNENKVLEAGEIAKKEVGEDKLKHDPTVGLEKQVKSRRKKSTPVQQVPEYIENPQPPALPAMVQDQLVLATQNLMALQRLQNDHERGLNFPLFLNPPPIFPFNLPDPLPGPPPFQPHHR